MAFLRKILTQISGKAAPSFAAFLFIFIISALVFDQDDEYEMKFELQSDSVGILEIFHDVGQGTLPGSRQFKPIIRSDSQATYSFPLEPGRYVAFRIDPGQYSGRHEIHDVRIVDPQGKTVHSFDESTFVINQGISELKQLDNGLLIVNDPTDNDPGLWVPLSVPVELKPSQQGWYFLSNSSATISLVVAIAGFLSCYAGLWIYARYRAGFARLAGRRPISTILAICVIGAIISAYPVVFFGKSYVFPPKGADMLYNIAPFLPGLTVTEAWDAKGSDIGATMWQNLPYSHVQRISLFEYGEFPFWNRYNAAGRPLLGQGHSMIFSPLHWLTLLSGDNAGLWDLKFVLAKIFFGFGTACAIFLATRSLSAASVVGFSLSFIGLYLHRYNHPAFFSLVYVPWIYVCWQQISVCRKLPGCIGWAIALSLVSALQMFTGFTKESMAAFIVVQFMGLLLFVLSPTLAKDKLRNSFILAIAGIACILFTAPYWLVFLSTLEQSFSFSDAPHARFLAEYNYSRSPTH